MLTYYVFVWYPWDPKWFRSRGMNKISALRLYLEMLPKEAKCKIRVFAGKENRIA